MWPGKEMTDTPRLTRDQEAIVALTGTVERLERELAEARNLLVTIREAMIIQGSNQRITDWKVVITAIDAARREHGK